jgi:flagellar assembly factor FliW
MTKVLDKRVINSALDLACDGAINVGLALSGSSSEISTRRCATTRFGVIDVDLDLIINFSEGLIGFESCREYVVVRHDGKSAFRWLQSLDEAGVAFPIIEPFAFRPDYAPTISDSDARMLNLKHDTPTLLFVVVSVPGQDPSAMTANLLAPLVINGNSRQGKQVIVQDEGYTTRHAVAKELERASKLAATLVSVTNVAANARTVSGMGAANRAA